MESALHADNSLLSATKRAWNGFPFEDYLVAPLVTPVKVGKTFWLYQCRGCAKLLLHQMWTKSSACDRWRKPLSLLLGEPGRGKDQWVKKGNSYYKEGNMALLEYPNDLNKSSGNTSLTLFFSIPSSSGGEKSALCLSLAALLLFSSIFSPHLPPSHPSLTVSHPCRGAQWE